ncbi:hypothetical protein LJC49_11105 [Ruminococcaceae bacterium OttesenSCG-928-I18]|nr:hypothetical protein [Ruminococcaceae bacterium OttesenSCG-928-I18]
MKKNTVVLIACALFLSLAACSAPAASSSAPSSAPSSAAVSSENTASSEPAISVKSEPASAAPDETIPSQLQGVWGTEDEESFTFQVFEGDVCHLFAAFWVPTEPMARSCHYTVDGGVITMAYEGYSDGPTTAPAWTTTGELSPDGTVLTVTSEDGTVYTLEKRQLPSDVEYYGGYENWKYGTAEVGLRLRAAPNTEAEIITSIDDELFTSVWVLGTSQADPTWLFVMYGSQVGFASGEYIQLQ